MTCEQGFQPGRAAVSGDALAAADRDTELCQCGDVGIYRFGRQGRAVIAVEPFKRARAGFEHRDGVPFHGKVERGGQTCKPCAGDGNALWLAAGLRHAPDAGVSTLDAGPFQSRNADRAAGLSSTASRLARMIANVAQDGGKWDDAGVNSACAGEIAGFRLLEHAPHVYTKRAARSARWRLLLGAARFPLFNALTVHSRCSWSGGSAPHNGHAPHPALSPWERGRLTTVASELPLPWGEGWGEAQLCLTPQDMGTELR